MTRPVGILALGLVGFWLVAPSAPDRTCVALAVGGTRPTLLKFARGARNASAVLGCALIVVGLVHYRSTEPHGEIHWVVLGMAVLVAGGWYGWSVKAWGVLELPVPAGAGRKPRRAFATLARVYRRFP